MALTINNAADYAEFGTAPTGLNGATALTALFTFIGSESSIGYSFLLKRDTSIHFACQTNFSSKMQCSVYNDADQVKTGTTDAGVTGSAGTYRIAIRWQASDNTWVIYVNGASRALTLGGTNITELRTSTSKVRVGAWTAGARGDYAEVAIYNQALPASSLIAYGKGLSPRFIPSTGRILYAPLVSSTSLIEEWSRNPITLSSMDTAPHPSMLRPAEPLFLGLASAGGGGSRRWLRRRTYISLHH